MKTFTCNICNQEGFPSPQALGAHKRITHPGQANRKYKKKRGPYRKKNLAVTVLQAEELPPTIEGVKYCPDCGHFLLPYNAAITAMKGRRS